MSPTAPSANRPTALHVRTTERAARAPRHDRHTTSDNNGRETGTPTHARAPAALAVPLVPPEPPQVRTLAPHRTLRAALIASALACAGGQRQRRASLGRQRWRDSLLLMLASLSPSQGLLVRAAVAPRLRQLLLLRGGAQPEAIVVEENSSAPLPVNSTTALRSNGVELASIVAEENSTAPQPANASQPSAQSEAPTRQVRVRGRVGPTPTAFPYSYPYPYP